ncbi:MAG: acetate--CoA ligase alpha subunit [Spirochaetota bacterium]
MLEKFFAPESVALIGASRSPGKVGYDILKNMIDGGYEGKVYPVNPKAGEVMGIKCYSDVREIPGQLDLAIVVIPSKLVPASVDQCAEKGVPAVIIISAGFSETGEKGAALARELEERIKKYKLRVIGPNCLGVISLPSKLNASFSGLLPERGNVAFISQSGALGTSILDVAVGEKIGISRFISYGNKMDINESELIQALSEDGETDVILSYIESIDNGSHFMGVASEATRKKPVIVMKSGRTSAGARAASSHTGSLAGSDSSYDAAFRQCGVIRARTITEFIDYAVAFSSQKPPRGNSVAIVTNAGGPGIIATDAIETSRLEIAELQPETKKTLAENLPPAASVHNPVDVLGDADAERYGRALEIVERDKNVDAVLIILSPQTMTDIEGTAEVVTRAASKTDKPVMASFIGSKMMTRAYEIMRGKKVPDFVQPERAVRALEMMLVHRQWKKKPAERVQKIEGNKKAVEEVIREAREKGMKALGERQARKIVESYGIRLPRSIHAPDEDQAVKAAKEVGFPVVMKISSEDILHKSDAGGVKLGLNGEEEVRKAYKEIRDAAFSYKQDAKIDGVLVQEMVQGGTEAIVGMSRDPQFGPVIMFGLGGIYVELLKDVSFRVAPLKKSDAGEMINEIKAAQILEGFRGTRPSDTEALKECLVRVSQLALDHPEFTECDLNPIKVFAQGEGLVAVDVRFGLRDVS